MAQRTRREAQRPEGWPTKDGRPATVGEIHTYIRDVEAHYLAPRVETDPHFCRGCTAPLEFEPCPVCWTHRYKGQVERLKDMINGYQESAREEHPREPTPHGPGQATPSAQRGGAARRAGGAMGSNTGRRRGASGGGTR